MTQIPNLAGLAQRKQQLEAQAKAGEAAFRIQLARDLFVQVYEPRAYDENIPSSLAANNAIDAADAFMDAIKEKP